jgi:hypothetical protein
MNTTDEQVKRDECQKIIASQEQLILDDLKQSGIDLVGFLEVRHPGDKQAKAIPLLLKHAEKKFMRQLKKASTDALPVQIG